MFFYLFRYGRNIQHLKYQVRDAKEIEDVVWQYATEASRRENNENHKKDENYKKARKWIKTITEKIYEGMETLKDAGEGENAGKMNRQRPKDAGEGENAGKMNRRRPNIISRYRLSKKADKLAQDIAELIDSDDAHSFQVVDIPSTKVVATKAILKALEDEEVRRIGLYGIPSGRMTAVLMNVGIKALERKVVNKVIWVIMPQSHELKEIQREFAIGLGLNPEDLKENANPEDLKENAKKLVTPDKTLVIFDDVHRYFNLDEIGTFEGNCKIVFTSREEKMCNAMGSQKNINMQEHVSKTWSTFKDRKDWQEKGVVDSIVKELVEDCEALSYGPGKEIDLLTSRSEGINQLTRQRKNITPYIVKEVKREIDKIMNNTGGTKDGHKKLDTK